MADGMLAGDAMTDEQPLERFADGDGSDAAFEAAMPALARLIRGYLIWFGAAPPLVEDLAQEAIVKVYIYRDQRRQTGVTSFKSWLRILCRNLVADGGREIRPTTALALAENAVDSVIDHDIREVLEVCIDRLREPDRTVFRLRYDTGWTTASIAELFGWKARNCELVLARARESISRCLRQSGCALSTGSKEQCP